MISKMFWIEVHIVLCQDMNLKLLMILSLLIILYYTEHDLLHIVVVTESDIFKPIFVLLSTAGFIYL